MSKVIDIKKVTFKKIVDLLKKENPNSIFTVLQGKVLFDNQKVHKISYNNTLKLENVSKKNQELLEKNFGFKKEKINYIKSPSPYKNGVLYYDYFDKDTEIFSTTKYLYITDLLTFQQQLKKIKNYYAFKWYYPLNDALDGESIYLNKKTGKWGKIVPSYLTNYDDPDVAVFKF